MTGGRDGEGMGALVSALQTLSEVSEFARLDEDVGPLFCHLLFPPFCLTLLYLQLP